MSRKVEPSSTFRNDFNFFLATFSAVAGCVRLGNVSCNLSCNGVAKQVAQKIVLCNSAFSPLEEQACVEIGFHAKAFSILSSFMSRDAIER